MDIVGYGDCAYCEGAPAEDVPAGLSLSRKPDGGDTDSNADDFVAADPTPGARNFFEMNLALSLDDDSILPCAGDLVPLCVSVVNRGMEAYCGFFSVSAGIVGMKGEDDREIGPLTLDPGAEVMVELAPGPAPAGLSILSASLSAAGDQNPHDDTISLSIISSPGTLLINEIMYRPLSGESEWIELRCMDASACSLSGWSICDATGRRCLISAGEYVIGAGEYCILAQDSALFCDLHPHCSAPVISPEGGWPWLNDSNSDGIADLIELRDDGGALYESIEYRDLLSGERGRSLERFSPYVCSDYPGGLWHRCLAPEGSTPGADNSTDFAGEFPVESLSIDPNPFAPEMHGRVTITGSAAESESGFFVRIFDIEGREVNRLYAEEGGAKIFSCSWDGRDMDGGMVDTGLYICVAEYSSMGGGVCRREKKGIAVYRKRR
jgi:hypothetical protein